MFLVRDLVSPRTWLALIHHWVGLFVGIAALTVFATCLSLGASLLVVALIGLPILGVMVWAADLFARAERARFAFLLGVPGVLLAVTLLVAALWRLPSWRSARALLAGSAALVWTTLLVFGHSMSSAMVNHASGADFAVGWQNRAAVLAWVVWVAFLAGRVLAIGRLGTTTAGTGSTA